jgi:hypothetical protein
VEEFILLMHGDATQAEDEAAWGPYLARLEAGGHLRGGSAIGGGVSLRKACEAAAVTGQLTGFVRVAADSLDAARGLVEGNPVYEAGGTVEVRALPRTE